MLPRFTSSNAPNNAPTSSPSNYVHTRVNTVSMVVYVTKWGWDYRGSVRGGSVAGGGGDRDERGRTTNTGRRHEMRARETKRNDRESAVEVHLNRQQIPGMVVQHPK